MKTSGKLTWIEGRAADGQRLDLRWNPDARPIKVTREMREDYARRLANGLNGRAERKKA